MTATADNERISCTATPSSLSARLAALPVANRCLLPPPARPPHHRPFRLDSWIREEVPMGVKVGAEDVQDGSRRGSTAKPHTALHGKGPGPPQVPAKARLVAKAGWFDIACLTVISTTTMGATNWNLVLVDGFVSGFVTVVVAAAQCIATTFCLSELVSAIPFSGGTYGFARVTMGKEMGLYIGICSGLQYVLRGGILCAYFGEAISIAAGVPDNLWFLVNAAVILFMTLLQVLAKGSIWKRIRISSVFITVVLVLFLCCCLLSGKANLAEHGKFKADEDGDAGWVREKDAFVHALPYSMMLFLGAEVGPFAAEDTIDPRVNVPKGMLRGVSFSIVLAFLTLLIGSSMPPGVHALYKSHFPISAVLQAVFQSNSGAFHLLSLPALYAASQSNSFAYGRVFYALARAGLLPGVFTRVRKGTGVPSMAIILGGALSYLVTLLLLMDGHDVNGFYHTLLYFMTFLSYMANVGMTMHSFWLLRVRCQSVTRFYNSPLGYPGVGFALCVMGVGFVGSWLADPMLWAAMVAMVIVLVLGMSYYFIVGYRYLKLSPEEAFAKSSRVTAEMMLSTGLGYSYLLKQCEKEYSTENIECWQAIDHYIKAPTTNAFKRIFEIYLCVGAPKAVNVPHSISNAIHDVNAALLKALEDEMGARLTMLPQDKPEGRTTGGRDLEAGPRMSSCSASVVNDDSDELMAAVQNVTNRNNAASPTHSTPTTPKSGHRRATTSESESNGLGDTARRGMFRGLMSSGRCAASHIHCFEISAFCPSLSPRHFMVHGIWCGVGGRSDPCTQEKVVGGPAVGVAGQPPVLVGQLQATALQDASVARRHGRVAGGCEGAEQGAEGAADAVGEGHAAEVQGQLAVRRVRRGRTRALPVKDSSTQPLHVDSGIFASAGEANGVRRLKHAMYLVASDEEGT